MKRTIFALSIALVLLLTSFALAEQTDLEQLARQYLPQDAVFDRTERDDGLVEYHFHAPDHQVTYEVDVDPTVPAVRVVEYDVRSDRDGKQLTVSEEQVRQKVLEVYPDAEISAVRTERDDGRIHYEVQFATAQFAGKIDVHCETGELLDRELYIKSSGEAASGPLTSEQAKKMVLSRAENGKIVEFKSEHDDGRLIYEGEVVSGNLRYEFEIDAQTGTWISWERDD